MSDRLLPVASFCSTFTPQCTSEIVPATILGDTSEKLLSNIKTYWPGSLQSTLITTDRRRPESYYKGLTLSNENAYVVPAPPWACTLPAIRAFLKLELVVNVRL